MPPRSTRRLCDIVRVLDPTAAGSDDLDGDFQPPPAVNKPEAPRKRGIEAAAKMEARALRDAARLSRPRSEAAAGGGTTTNATGKLSSASRASCASESEGDAVKVSSSTSQASRKKKGPQYNLRFVRVNHRTIPLDRTHSPARSSVSRGQPTIQLGQYPR